MPKMAHKDHHLASRFPINIPICNFFRIGQFVSCLFDGKKEPSELAQQESDIIDSGLQEKQVNDLKKYAHNVNNVLLKIF